MFARSLVLIALASLGSMGVATSTDPDPGALIARADRALYEAKQAGRDRAVVAPDT